MVFASNITSSVSAKPLRGQAGSLAATRANDTASVRYRASPSRRHAEARIPVIAQAA
jgi:hypothetical protein